MLTFEHRVASADEQWALAAAVGWRDHFARTSLADALAGSLHGVVAVDDGVVVGAGRLVGDGVRYFYVQDVLVRPEASEQGVASAIVERLLAWVREQVAGEAIVGLFSSPEAIGVYQELGFVGAGGDPLGMTLTISDHGSG